MDYIKNFLERFDFLYRLVMLLLIGGWVGGILNFYFNGVKSYSDLFYYFIYFKEISFHSFSFSPSFFLLGFVLMYIIRWLISGKTNFSL